MSIVTVRRGLTIGLLALLASACATSPTGRSQFLLVPPVVAIEASEAAYVDTVAQLRDERQLLNDPQLAARVRVTAGRVVAAAVTQYPHTADWDWSVALIDDPDTVNAWCMAGGRMAIYSGIVYKLGLTDDELANVFGHEVSHAIANHTAERMSMALVTELGLLAFAAKNEDPETRLAMEMAATLAVNLPNSRAGETEADRMGIELAAQAREMGEVRVLATRVEVEEAGALRTLADNLREHLGSGLGVVGTVLNGKVSLIAVVTPDLIETRGLKAGDIVKRVARLVGGSGGGKPHLAQAGGKDAEKLDQALAAVPGIVKELLAE